MKIETGYIYHIKDAFFDKINDRGILWFIHLSSKIEKYKPIIKEKEKSMVVANLLW